MFARTTGPCRWQIERPRAGSVLFVEVTLLLRAAACGASDRGGRRLGRRDIEAARNRIAQDDVSADVLSRTSSHAAPRRRPRVGETDAAGDQDARLAMIADGVVGLLLLRHDDRRVAARWRTDATDTSVENQRQGLIRSRRTTERTARQRRSGIAPGRVG
jgi:hypothetical protein